MSFDYDLPVAVPAGISPTGPSKRKDLLGCIQHHKDAMLGRFYATYCCCRAMHAHQNGTPTLASSGYVVQVDAGLCTARTVPSTLTNPHDQGLLNFDISILLQFLVNALLQKDLDQRLIRYIALVGNDS